MKPILFIALVIGIILCSPMARRTGEVAMGNQQHSIAGTTSSPSPYLFVWAAADRSANRLVVTGNNKSWILIVNFDRETGKLTVDENFKVKDADYPGIDFDRTSWPHGASGKAVVHGALFGSGQ